VIEFHEFLRYLYRFQIYLLPSSCEWYNSGFGWIYSQPHGRAPSFSDFDISWLLRRCHLRTLCSVGHRCLLAC